MQTYDKWSDPDFCLEAVRNDVHTLNFVKEQTPEICLAAVRKRGYALRYVREQTLEVCMAAVQEDGFVLMYVKKEFRTQEFFSQLVLKDLKFAKCLEEL